MATHTTPTCGFCGLRVLASSVWSGGRFFHPECAQPPQTFQPIPLTEDRLRQIIREELAALAATSKGGA